MIWGDQMGLGPRRSGRGLGSDSVGMYLMTDDKSAGAMANQLANLLAKHQLLSCGDWTMNGLPQPLHSIDMTAGVGGNTIACAKRFDLVTAFEIDAGRASLLKENLAQAAAASSALDLNAVTINCADTLKELPRIGEQARRRPVAAILDPPWGGIHYKSETVDAAAGGLSSEEQEVAADEGLALGGVALSRVVARKHASNPHRGSTSRDVSDRLHLVTVAAGSLSPLSKHACVATPTTTTTIFNLPSTHIVDLSRVLVVLGVKQFPFGRTGVEEAAAGSNASQRRHRWGDGCGVELCGRVGEEAGPAAVRRAGFGPGSRCGHPRGINAGRAGAAPETTGSA